MQVCTWYPERSSAKNRIPCNAILKRVDEAEEKKYNKNEKL